MLQEEAKEIADTILMQLGGAGKLKAMIKANNFMFSPEGALTFSFKGSKKASAVKIELNAMDLYDLTFYKWGTRTDPDIPGIRINTVKIVQKYNGIYDDQLKDIIEEFTKLRLSL